MADTLSVISLVSFIVSGICFLLAVFFWFKFRILTIIGDLSGRTAQKSIERMRSYNEKSGGKAYKSNAVNIGRGKITDTLPPSEKLKQDNSKKKSEQVETGLLSTNKVEIAQVYTAELPDSCNTTALLDDSGTELLEEYTAVPLPEKHRKGVKLEIIDETILIHTDEVI
ncbi:MAG: hypothetical protein RR846_01550 [Oscillospiraceae bacterium]